MLLLLLVGAGVAQASQRAYATTTYAAVTSTATVETSVTLASTDENAVTNATTTEE